MSEYPIPASDHFFTLWALGKILILFGMTKPEDRRVLFLRLETMLEVYGVRTQA